VAIAFPIPLLAPVTSATLSLTAFEPPLDYVKIFRYHVAFRSTPRQNSNTIATDTVLESELVVEVAMDTNVQSQRAEVANKTTRRRRLESDLSAAARAQVPNLSGQQIANTNLCLRALSAEGIVWL
jgi:hypothetical protein